MRKTIQNDWAFLLLKPNLIIRSCVVFIKRNIKSRMKANSTPHILVAAVFHMDFMVERMPVKSENTCCFEDERYAVAKSKGKSRSTQVRSKLAIQVGERIRKTRKQEGLSIENFALRCDIHPSYVGHIERGMQNPTLSTLERISQGLGISMDDLFKDIDTPINVENAAIRHLSQVISELSPEQTQQLLQIVDSVMAIKNEYL